MTILLTGSSGKTSSRLASLLSQSSHPFLVASRSGSASAPYTSVRFDWLDPATYDGVFTAPPARHSPITAAYLVAPPVSDPLPSMKAFADFSRDKGIKRFVLLSSSAVKSGETPLGKMHAYLETSGLEWTVLRPSWFMENFSEGPYLSTIRQSSQISSATLTGKVPFVSAHDIAAVAYQALTDPKPHNTAHIIRGPELLSYDGVAGLLSEVLGRSVEHVRLLPSERTEGFVRGGVEREWAELLTWLDVGISEGREERLNDVVERVTGRKPVGMREFLETNKEVWTGS
ncbi:MAG: hypothetical protein Q9160_001030 [Pyrenula sp. 1 TL-2023]